jgi:serine/threonine protein kinase
MTAMDSNLGQDQLRRSVLIQQHIQLFEEGHRSKLSASYNQTDRSQLPIDGIASFCKLVAELRIGFKPRTMERPWAIQAGKGGNAIVECHRYVPGKQFDNFNTVTGDTVTLKAISLDPTRTGECYAVKRLHCGGSGAASNEAYQYDQLATELRVLAYSAMRDHKNILNILGVAHYLSEPLLVLEDANCGDLLQFMQFDLIKVRRTLELKMKLCADVARGLEVLHNHEVVHGDLKNVNILITCTNTEFFRNNTDSTSSIMCRNFVAKLCDFGLSLILSDHTSTSVFPKVYTDYWSAPEVLSRKPISKTMLPRIDVYSAGLVFASIFLEGNHPYSALAERISTPEKPFNAGMVNDMRQTSDLSTPIAFAKFVLEIFPLLLRVPTGYDDEMTVNFGNMYCAWELNIFSKILTVTLQEEPDRRLSSGGELLQFLVHIWNDTTMWEWRNHREQNCSGALADFENNFKASVEFIPSDLLPYELSSVNRGAGTCGW